MKMSVITCLNFFERRIGGWGWGRGEGGSGK